MVVPMRRTSVFTSMATLCRLLAPVWRAKASLRHAFFMIDRFTPSKQCAIALIAADAEGVNTDVNEIGEPMTADTPPEQAPEAD